MWRAGRACLVGHVGWKGVGATSSFQAECPPTCRKPQLQLESLSPSLVLKTPVLPSSHRQEPLVPGLMHSGSLVTQSKGRASQLKGCGVEDQHPPQATQSPWVHAGSLFTSVTTRWLLRASVSFSMKWGFEGTH